MKKIDFQHFRVANGIKQDVIVEMDVREQLADVIYNNVNGIAALTLAQKIYKSDGETEYDEREIKTLTEVVDNICFAAIVDAYHKIIDNN